jgi:hypothetical protein
MLLQEIKEGEIFTIGETPSYPKLKTKTGYIDMRDLIVKNCDEISHDLRIMTKDEVAKKFGGTIQELDEWINEISK